MANSFFMTIDDFYISPFTGQRTYNTEGQMSWIPMERNLRPTGIPRLDYVAQLLAEGVTDLDQLASRLRCKREHLNGWTYAMFGMNALKFRHQYIFRLADDLMRYTSLSLEQIARRVGCYSASTLCQIYIKHRHVKPDAHRQAIRQPRDVGRFRVWEPAK